MSDVLENCPRCKAPLRQRIEGSTLIIECTRCDYNLATTAPHVAEESRERHVIIRRGTTLERNVIARIAVELGLSAVRLSLDLKRRNVVVAAGDGLQVRKAVKLLQANAVPFSVEYVEEP